MYIPLEECKHGYLYKINSRNLTFGVFNSGQSNTGLSNGFIGLRVKFDETYLFTEYHWDTGPPIGTVHPKVELEKCPLELNEDSEELFNWLKEKELAHA